MFFVSLFSRCVVSFLRNPVFVGLYSDNLGPKKSTMKHSNLTQTASPLLRSLLLPISCRSFQLLWHQARATGIGVNCTYFTYSMRISEDLEVNLSLIAQLSPCISRAQVERERAEREREKKTMA